MSTSTSDGGTSVHNVRFPGQGGPAHGYLELPPSGTGPGLVVIQEWWGLDDHLAGLVRRFAAEGFVALAPDLYGGRVTHDATQAAAMKRALPLERAVQDLSGAVDLLLAHDAVTSTSVGAVGFCMGGAFVMSLAAREGDRVSAAVPFYGKPPADLDYSGLRAAVQGHYGDRDRSISREDVVSMVTSIRLQSGVEPHVFWYPAGHAFLNDTRDAYDPHSAGLAWSRAVQFLSDRVR